MYGILSSIFIRRNYTEVCSPFMQPDFISYCMSIPLKWRLNHKIYDEWVIQKYPQAATFRWSHNDKKITDSKIVGRLRQIRYRGLDKFKRILGGRNYHSSYGMNPYDFWYFNNDRIEDYFASYFGSHINHPLISSDLKNDMEFLMKNGNTIDKTLVMTVLSAFTYYFS